MSTTYKKLIKADGPASDLEKQVATHLSDLASSEELKNQLAELYFVGAEVCRIFKFLFSRF